MKQLITFLIISLTFSLVGCGFKDIDKRFFVVSIGVDKATNSEKKYSVLLKLAIPDAEPKMGAEKFLVMSEESDSISEAVRIIKSRVDKELDFGHAKIIAFGEDVANENIENIMDWFTRRRDIQNIAWVMIARPTAKEILKLKPKAERIPANSFILAFGEEGTETPYITSTYLFKFMRDMTELGVNAVLPIVELGKEEDMFDINKLAVIKDGKTALTLNKDETKTFNALYREHKKMSIYVEEEGEKFMVNVNSIKRDYKINADNNNQPYVHYDIDIVGTIEEALTSVKVNDIEKYGELAAKASKKRVEELLRKFQKEGVDPLGLGLRYRATHLGEEEVKQKKWQELYPQIEFRVNVNTKVDGVGIISR